MTIFWWHQWHKHLNMFPSGKPSGLAQLHWAQMLRCYFLHAPCLVHCEVRHRRFYSFPIEPTNLWTCKYWQVSRELQSIAGVVWNNASDGLGLIASSNFLVIAMQKQPLFQHGSLNSAIQFFQETASQREKKICSTGLPVSLASVYSHLV